MGSHIFHDFCTRIWSNLSWLNGINVDAIAFSCSNESKQLVIILHKIEAQHPNELPFVMDELPPTVTVTTTTTTENRDKSQHQHHHHHRWQNDLVLDAFSIDTN